MNERSGGFGAFPYNEMEGKSESGGTRRREQKHKMGNRPRPDRTRAVRCFPKTKSNNRRGK